MPKFIDQIATGDASGAKNTMSDMLSAKAFEALDIRKQELAASLFGGSPQEVQEEQLNLEDFSLEELEEFMVSEEFEQLDEVSKKTATSAYVARMGREDDKSPAKAVKTMDRIYKKHGATGVMRAATAADKKYGIHSADYTKKDFVGDYLSGQGK
jgi:hypothetical protein